LKSGLGGTQGLLPDFELFLEATVGPDHRPFSLDKGKGLMVLDPEFLHEVGDDQRATPRHSKRTMHQHTIPLSHMLLDELADLLEVLGDVFPLRIDDPHVKVVKIFGIVGHKFSPGNHDSLDPQYLQQLLLPGRGLVTDEDMSGDLIEIELAEISDAVGCSPHGGFNK
jgi:hypothetical protein